MAGDRSRHRIVAGSDVGVAVGCLGCLAIRGGDTKAAGMVGSQSCRDVFAGGDVAPVGVVASRLGHGRVAGGSMRVARAAGGRSGRRVVVGRDVSLVGGNGSRVGRLTVGEGDGWPFWSPRGHWV